MTKKIKLKISARLLKKRFRRQALKGKKQCRFCESDQHALQHLDYKNAVFLRGFLTERGKILPSRISGACCRHQRMLSGEIRKARTMALVPYCAPNY
ncbi:30S ribosomal protein S18 [Candidatus Dependentiae bacterium]|nr:30S ribosomal protein S18 [Candidatus Dependentiae bacterium]